MGGRVGVGEGEPAVVRFSVLSFHFYQPVIPLTPTSCSKCTQTSRAEKGSVARVHLHQTLDHDRILQTHFSEWQVLPDCSWRELFAAQPCIAWLPPETPVEREAESSRQLTVLGEEHSSGEETTEHGPGYVIHSVQSCL